LLPFALTIFGFSIPSLERERFSEAPVAGAGCSFFCLAVFFAGFAGASAFEVAGFSLSWEALGGAVDAGSFVFGSSAGLGSVGFSGSAIILISHLHLAGFGFRIADNAHGLAWALARPGIRRSALSAHGQAFPMPNSAITIDCLQTFQVTLYITTQIAFNLDLVVRDRVDDFVHLLRRKIFRTQVGIDVGLLENASGCAKADSVDIGERRLNAFVCRNFDS
jgi:hypothetical protein